ncbi:hypothetical protein WDU94_014392 [Cyamophila willieti]
MSDAEANSNEEEYFESYADLEVHKLMLADSVRNEAYRTAICDNPDIFNGKTVLDVGTGTGFLAILCAKAGATKVYAVEASDMAELATINVHENEVVDKVQVVQSRVEDVELPEKVDIIISEWMGFYLLHESMLDSVIFARDKFLKPEGLMYPYKCILYSAPSYSPDLFEFWGNISGVQMNTIGQLYRTKYTGKPEIMELDPNNILSKPVEVYQFNTKDVQLNDLNNISKNVYSECIKNGHVNGISLWFDVFFHASNKSDIILSTAPVSSPSQLTHWKQTVIVLPTEKAVVKTENVHYKLFISKNESNPRHYNIELSFLDSDESNTMESETVVDKKKEEFKKHHNADSDYDEYNSSSDD